MGLRARRGNRAQQEARNEEPAYHSAATLLAAPPLGDQLACQRNQFAAIFDGVDQRIEAADQKVADAEVVIIAEHFGDLLRRSDQAVGVLLAPVSLAISVHSPLVDPGALLASANSRRAPAVA